MPEASSGPAAKSPIFPACCCSTSRSSSSPGPPPLKDRPMPIAELPATAWRAGAFERRAGQLLFGRMYEDASIELEHFPPRSRVFCIASAGCTAFALAAAGHRVTALDINPAQVEYVSARACGAPAQTGAAERLLANGRRLL